MALQILFGDDEHTASDGPYSRLMKVRKWMYLSSGALLLLAHGLYSEDKLATLFTPVRFPSWLLGPALASGLMYLLVQYGLLAIQLRTTYDIALKERLRFRRVEELASAQLRVDSARERVTARLSELRANDLSDLATLAADIQATEDEIGRMAREAEDLRDVDRRGKGTPLAG